MEDEENLLYFIMKKSPNLERWKREILRIVYKTNQYFYPQGQTKNLNEGMATFCHYYIMTRLEEKGMLSSDAFLNFLDHHAGVIFQPTYQKRYYSGINPYALGFAICQDIKRICTNPTAEDKEWFPNLIGKRWQDAVKEAVFEHRDDSFVAQYLSPKVIRDLKIFSVGLKYDGDEQEQSVDAVVTEIHDELGYANIRTALARSMERINYVPQIKVIGADLEGDRTLKLKYEPYKGRGLELSDAEIVTDYIDYLWGYPVELDG
jgi:spore cortex formation protein SpoVR/YcgB (stage V sporulation)